MFPATLAQQRIKNNFMNWISIKESLPPFDQNVLVSVAGSSPYVTIASLESKKEYSGGCTLQWDDFQDRGNLSNVVFWMPLPEPATISEK